MCKPTRKDNLSLIQKAYTKFKHVNLIIVHFSISPRSITILLPNLSPTKNQKIKASTLMENSTFMFFIFLENVLNYLNQVLSKPYRIICQK